MAAEAKMQRDQAKAKAKGSRTTSGRAKALSRRHPPEGMSLEEWQRALRREFGRKAAFRLRNLGSRPVFSEFRVTNPEKGTTYYVSIRGRDPWDNTCTCPDFAVNTLGTCKHIEFVLGRLEKRRGGKKALEEGFRPPFPEILLRPGARREIVLRPGARSSQAFLRYAKRHFDEGGRLKDSSYAAFERILERLRKLDGALRVGDGVLAHAARVRDRARLAERIDRAFPKGATAGAFKGLLKIRLYPYQRKGALFAARAGRALIADDMGLGKTIQALAAAEILARVMGIERVLVVSPTSLKHQWAQEIGRATGRSVQVVQGLIPARQRAYREESFYKITNYDVIYRDLEAIRAWGPDLVILDEAQRIKNWKTRTAKSVKGLRSPYALVLTGTPLENRLEELHSIMEFLDPYRLGPLFRFLHNHQELDESGKVIGYRNLSAITRTLAPILVRRTRDEVLKELPERLEKRVFLPMTEEQVRHHQENQEVVARIVVRWRKRGFLTEEEQQRLMRALQNMRMAADSTYLLDSESRHGVKPGEILSVLEEVLADPGVKVVVFSQWIRMHALILEGIRKKGWGHVFLNGQVPGPKRKEIVRKFREDPECRIFLSTDAGGVGLNLQAASVVLNADLPWNPAVLEQRIGRVHRLGQKRTVRVVHFISEGSIEHGMLPLLAFKKALFAGVLDGERDEVFLGEKNLGGFMKSVEKVMDAIPEKKADLTSCGADSASRAGRKDGGGRSKRTPEAQAVLDLVRQGKKFLDLLGAALEGNDRKGPHAGTSPNAPSLPALEKDPSTGKTYLKVPLPEKGALQKAAALLQAFLGGAGG